jgi:hypothetical protein
VPRKKFKTALNGAQRGTHKPAPRYATAPLRPVVVCTAVARGHNGAQPAPALPDMTRVRLMESPGPGYGHRGFLVQRNHESGGIVIVFSLSEKRDSHNGVITTFCNRDIFTIGKSWPVQS